MQLFPRAQKQQITNEGEFVFSFTQTHVLLPEKTESIFTDYRVFTKYRQICWSELSVVLADSMKYEQKLGWALKYNCMVYSH